MARVITPNIQLKKDNEYEKIIDFLPHLNENLDTLDTVVGGTVDAITNLNGLFGTLGVNSNGQIKISKANAMSNLGAAPKGNGSYASLAAVEQAVADTNARVDSLTNNKITRGYSTPILNKNGQGVSQATVRQVFEAAAYDVLYIWSDYNSATYSPSGANGNWSFLLFKPVANNNSYGMFIATRQSDSAMYFYDVGTHAWRPTVGPQSTLTGTSAVAPLRSTFTLASNNAFVAKQYNIASIRFGFTTSGVIEKATALTDCMQIAAGYRPWQTQDVQLVPSSNGVDTSYWYATLYSTGKVTIRNKHPSNPLPEGTYWVNTTYICV